MVSVEDGDEMLKDMMGIGTDGVAVGIKYLRTWRGWGGDGRGLKDMGGVEWWWARMAEVG